MITASIPLTYCYNGQHIHFVPDASYNIPAINDKVIINNLTFTVINKKLMPIITGKRQYFVDLKLSNEDTI